MDIVTVAQGEIGYKEGANNNSKYGAWYGLNYNPWCAMFISWCANKAGISTDIIPKFASCGVGYNFFKSKGRIVKDVQAGDILFFDWNLNNSPDHVGIVEKVAGDTITTIEGNASNEKSGEGDCVKRRSFSKTYKYIFAIARPNYNNSTIKEIVGKIADIQSTLNSRYNLNIAVDNIYGKETKKALVKALQTELNKQYNKNLNVDGVFGEKTKSACITLKKGAKGNITWILQAMLVCKGYSIEVDGDFGINTENAVKDFQSKNRLIVDGIAGKNTFSKLFS